MSLDANISDPESKSFIMLGELVRVADDYFVKTGGKFPPVALLLGNNWVFIGQVTRLVYIPPQSRPEERSNESLLAIPQLTGAASPNVSLATYLDPLVEQIQDKFILAVLPIGERRRVEAEQLPDRRDHLFYFSARYKGTELYIFTKIPQEYGFVSASVVKIH